MESDIYFISIEFLGKYDTFDELRHVVISIGKFLD